MKKMEARIAPNPKQYSGRKCGFALLFCTTSPSQDSVLGEDVGSIDVVSFEISQVCLLKQACVKASSQLSGNISNHITQRSFCQGNCLRIKHEMNTSRPTVC